MSLRSRLRGWLGIGEELRGTLIATDEGYVLSLPPNATQELVAQCRDRLRAWLDDGAMLVLPFPVDFKDGRTPIPSGMFYTKTVKR